MVRNITHESYFSSVTILLRRVHERWLLISVRKLPLLNSLISVNPQEPPRTQSSLSLTPKRFCGCIKVDIRRALWSTKHTENVGELLMAYRSTPSTAIPNNALPAEVFLGRRMRIRLNVMYPTVAPTIRNDKMAERFEWHHNAKPGSFDEFDRVYVRDFRHPINHWKPGVIISYSGNVIDTIDQGNRIIKWHANHIRR